MCLIARVIAWPLMFSTAGMVQGIEADPAQSVIASGIGEGFFRNVDREELRDRRKRSARAHGLQ